MMSNFPTNHIVTRRIGIIIKDGHTYRYQYMEYRYRGSYYKVVLIDARLLVHGLRIPQQKGAHMVA